MPFHEPPDKAWCLRIAIGVLLWAAIAPALRAQSHLDGPATLTIDSLFVSQAVAYSLTGDYPSALIPVQFESSSVQPDPDPAFRGRGFTPELISVVQRVRLGGQDDMLGIKGFFSLIDIVGRRAQYGFSADYRIQRDGKIRVAGTNLRPSLPKKPAVSFVVLSAMDGRVGQIEATSDIQAAMRILGEIPSPEIVDGGNGVLVDAGPHYVFAAFLDRVASDARAGVYFSRDGSSRSERPPSVLAQDGWLLTYAPVEVSGRQSESLTAQAVFQAAEGAGSAVVGQLKILTK